MNSSNSLSTKLEAIEIAQLNLRTLNAKTLPTDWEPSQYQLPVFNREYLLTPEFWIQAGKFLGRPSKMSSHD